MLALRFSSERLHSRGASLPPLSRLQMELEREAGTPRSLPSEGSLSRDRNSGGGSSSHGRRHSYSFAGPRGYASQHNLSLSSHGDSPAERAYAGRGEQWGDGGGEWGGEEEREGDGGGLARMSGRGGGASRSRRGWLGWLSLGLLGAGGTSAATAADMMEGVSDMEIEVR